MAMFAGLILKHSRKQTNKETQFHFRKKNQERKVQKKKMASNNNYTEERRRRITERGSDRMALITGRINALPPTPRSANSSPIHPRHTQSMSVSAFDSHYDKENDHLPHHTRPHSLASTAFATNFVQDNVGLYFAFSNIKIVG